MIVTRFAPSPTGYLHLGHAFAAITAFETAGPGGRFLLRIEDIDRTRARPAFEAAIAEDLAWLGLVWERPVRRQSEHFDDYRAALNRLAARDLLYPCFCTRKEIAEEIARAGEAPHGAEGPLYPGTCRALSPDMRTARIASGAPYALRLDMGRALQIMSEPLFFDERGCGPAGETGRQRATPEDFGDVVLARKDIPASYHLAVVVDDAAQGVTCVTRGEDLFSAAHIQRLLQALLGLPVPDYAHHRLILDAEGRKFSKRDRAATLRDRRAVGAIPADIGAMLGFPTNR